MKPQLQCPNCLQFELGFKVLVVEKEVDHQQQLTAGPNETRYLGCKAFDCAYVGRAEQFFPKEAA